MKKFQLLKYLLVFLFCIAVTGLFSCDMLLKKAEKLSSDIPINYPGLRLETRALNNEKLKYFDKIIICFGDSVTYGWNLKYSLSYPEFLDKKLSGIYPGIKVINSGVGGNTVVDAHERINKDIINFNPGIVIMNFGLNDAMLKKKSTRPPGSNEYFYKDKKLYYLPQVNLELFSSLYESMILEMQNNDIKVIVTGITPVTDDFFIEGVDNFFLEKQKEIYNVYNNEIKKVAYASGAFFVNLYDIFENQDELKEYIQDDGIHPDIKGQELISNSIFEYILQYNILND